MKYNLTGAQYAASKYNEYQVRENCQLMDFLSRQMAGISRNRLKDILRGNGVSVDRQVVTRHDFQLKPGMVVRVSKHRRATELRSQWIKIIYEDKYIVVVDKAPGILSMAATPRQFCVKDILDKYFQQRHFGCHAHVVHRLDQFTSGLLVYAKTIETARILQTDWKSYCYDRRYVAVVCGRMEAEGGKLESWLRDDKNYVTHSSPVETEGSKHAVTYFHTLRATDQYSLVELRLETGRKNQIRVHMADTGHPIVGDLKYGNARNPLDRLCLHAFRLYLTHPVTGERLEFQTPYPTAFLRLVGGAQE